MINHLSTNSFLTKISSYRSNWMGIAIIMVLLFHFVLWTHTNIPPFRIGFLGVDIFMLLSGYGLTYSLNNSKGIFKFYKKRARRILPLYILVTFIYHIQGNNEGSIFELFLQITTLNYWLGRSTIDWYLNSLIGFYIIFPVLDNLVEKFKMKIYVFALMFSSLFFAINDNFINLTWQLECGIARIPIFITGILIAKGYLNTTNLKYYIISSVLLVLPVFLFLSHTFAASLLTIPLLLLISLIPKINFIEFMGKHSLELYVANLVVFLFVYSSDDYIFRVCSYILVQIAFSLIFIKLNKIIQNKIFSR